MKKKVFCLFFAGLIFTSLFLDLSGKSLRDPFFLRKKKRKKTKRSHFSLLGIVKADNRLGAIIKHKKQEKVVFQGDQLQKYYVQAITNDKVVLEVDGKERFLKLKNKD